MGTNFYFMCKVKELVQNSFAIKESWEIHGEEYEIVDESYLGYEIHLNKLSCGWRPLFQRHKAFNTFNQLKEFYFTNKEKLEIFDEAEAELSVPFEHALYIKSEKEAMKRFGVFDRFDIEVEYGASGLLTQIIIKTFVN